MFLCAFQVFILKKSLFKCCNSRLCRVFCYMCFKKLLQTLMVLVNVLKTFYELNKVIAIKSSMNKGEERLKLFFPVIDDKVVRTLAHKGHHFGGIGNDAFTISPSDRGSKKS